MKKLNWIVRRGKKKMKKYYEVSKTCPSREQAWRSSIWLPNVSVGPEITFETPVFQVCSQSSGSSVRQRIDADWILNATRFSQSSRLSSRVLAITFQYGSNFAIRRCTRFSFICFSSRASFIVIFNATVINGSTAVFWYPECAYVTRRRNEEKRWGNKVLWLFAWFFLSDTKPAGQATWNNGEQCFERGDGAVGCLRLVVVHSCSEDDHAGMVHWENSCDETGKICYFDLYFRKFFESDCDRVVVRNIG